MLATWLAIGFIPKLSCPNCAWAAAIELESASMDRSTAEGVFLPLSGDPRPDAGAEPRDAFMLGRKNGEMIRLNMGEIILKSLGELRKFHFKPVSVTGTFLQPGKLNVESISPSPLAEPLPAQSIAASYPWLSILCKFSNVSNEPKPLSYFENFFGNTFPLFNHYWPELSYDLVGVSGSAAVGWFTLPHPRSYYVYDSDGDGYADFDFDRATTDCVAAAGPSVSLSGYIGINLMFNSELDDYAWGGKYSLYVDGQYKLFNMTWEPPWGYSNQGVLAHEMGHGFGLPHSSGSYGYTYDNCWDVMSDNWSPCNFNYDSVYGCVGQHTIAYHKDLLSWIPPDEKFIALSGTNTVELENLALPASGNYKMVQVPIGGSATHFYTVEARDTVGYDYGLPGKAVIIHEVDTNRSRPAYVVDQDGNGNPCDAGAMWTTGEVFTDSQNEISIRVGLETASGYVVTVAQSLSPASRSTTGVFRPSNGLIYLKSENSSGYADAELVFGIPGDIPIAGDWDGDGVDTIGVYRDSVFYLKNSNETGYADMVFAFGADGDLPVAGDWDGDGVDTIGVYRDGLFMLRNANDTGEPDIQFALGIPGDIPIAGNWDGIGGDSTGIFRPTNGLIYLKNQNSSGYADIEIVFGIPNDKPVTGDWDGDGIDTIGVYRDGAFLLRNSNETGYAEMVFGLGIDGDVPISGKWGLP